MIYQKTNRISDNTIRRIPRYLRCLNELEQQGNSRASSAQIGAQMNATASQVRQDLSHFGNYGMQGYGYNIDSLRKNIREILGTNVEHTAVMVGIGSLGHALLEHLPLAQNGYSVLAGFDLKAELIGRKIGDIPIKDAGEFKAFVSEHRPEICILTVPASEAAHYAKLAADSGVKAIWNFANIDLKTLRIDAVIENVNLMDSLFTLTYYSAKTD